MVQAALIALVFGMGLGFGFNQFFTEQKEYVSYASTFFLYLMMFTIGTSVGLGESIIKQLKQYGIKVVLIPIAITIGSIFGGYVSGIILDFPIYDSLAIGSAMGWYSLSGIMIESLSSPHMGVVAFLSNLAREISALVLIPMIIKYTNSYAAIGIAAATSGDSTLPLVVKYGGEKYLIPALINGILCSLFVPFLINFIYSLK